MDIWVLQWSSSDDANVSLWQTEQDALTQAASEIQSGILADWDMNDPEVHDTAKSIFDTINSGNIRQAIHEWNDAQSELGYDYPSWYSVTKKNILNGPQAVQTIILGTNAPPVMDADDYLGYPKIITPEPIQAAGATCRGPCGSFNEYAYSDRMDGTFCCYSCKLTGAQ